MSNLAISFASLVKNNNGLFKSEKQAEFLLKMCQESMTFIAPGNVGRHGYCLYYICDEKGVVRIEKSLQSKGGVTVTWERRGEGKVTVQDAKLIKQLKRYIKQFERNIKERRDSKEKYFKDNDEYMMGLYYRSEERELLLLEGYKKQLLELGITV
jgi:hypothetical protein